MISWMSAAKFGTIFETLRRAAGAAKGEAAS